MGEEKTKRNYLGQAWLVLALALCFGSALAGVEIVLKGRIDDNKLAETRGQIPALVPGAEGGQAVELAGRTVYRAMSGNRQVGWVIPAGGQGFADKIEVLIGLDASAERLTGLYVLSQKETPGLGNRITEGPWLGQFAGKAAASPLAVSKAEPLAGNEILAVTGATISSESVARIVNQAVAEFRQALAEQAGKD